MRSRVPASHDPNSEGAERPTVIQATKLGTTTVPIHENHWSSVHMASPENRVLLSAKKLVAAAGQDVKQKPNTFLLLCSFLIWAATKSFHPHGG